MASLRFATSGLALTARRSDDALHVDALALTPTLPLHLALRLSDDGPAALLAAAGKLLRALPEGEPWPSVVDLATGLATLARQAKEAPLD